MATNEPSQSDPDRLTTQQPLLNPGDEMTIEELQADWRRKAEAAKAEHAPIVDDIRHRKALESISRSMPALTPQQVQARDEEIAERERQRRLHARHERWIALVQERGDRYADCRLGNYEAGTEAQRKAVAQLTDYCREMPDRLAAGESVILAGPKGTGKDHLAMAMARVAVVNHGKYVSWQNGMDLFGDIRDAMDKGEAERTLVNRLVKPDVLYLSDPVPPIGPLSPHQMVMLFRILDGRYSRRRATWVTVNVASPSELEQRLGPQSADRLRHDTLAIACTWGSYRTGGRS